MKSNPPRGPWVIIIITLLLVAVVLILGNQSFKATEQAAFYEFNQRQLALAKGAANGIELYFDSLAGDMRALGRIPGVQHLDEIPTRREIQHTFDKLEPLGVNDIGVLDANGILRYNAMAHEIEGVDFSWRRYYQETKGITSSDTCVVEFIEFKGVEAGQKGVLVAVALFEIATDKDYPAPSGQFAGVILCTLRLDTITRRFVASIKSSERGHAFLLDDEYRVLWAPDTALFGKNLLEEGEGFPTFQQIRRICRRVHHGHHRREGHSLCPHPPWERVLGSWSLGAQRGCSTVDPVGLSWTSARGGNEHPDYPPWLLFRSGCLISHQQVPGEGG
jgi:hypothetical protein